MAGRDTGPRMGLVYLADGWHPAALLPGRQGTVRAVTIVGAGGHIGARRVPADRCRDWPQGAGDPDRALATLRRLAARRGTKGARRLLGIGGAR